MNPLLDDLVSVDYHFLWRCGFNCDKHTSRNWKMGCSGTDSNSFFKIIKQSYTKLKQSHINERNCVEKNIQHDQDVSELIDSD